MIPLLQWNRSRTRTARPRRVRFTAHGEPLETLCVLTGPVGATRLPPVAGDDAFDVAEDTTAALNLLANDSDPDGTPLRISGLTPPPASEATRVDNGDGTVTFTPAA